jgi:MoxR-like ATPase
MKFQGSDQYVATQDLMLAVNAAITLKRPLLVKGEPGTGKTMLAEEVAQRLNMPLLQWHIKSTTKAQQGLYEYDAVSRLRDSQLGDAKVKDIHNYIVKGVLWQAFTAEQPVALLIDEIDKADIEFPNDLLRELDRMEFYVYETRELVQGAAPPGGLHHLQQREGAARRLPAPLLLPLHQVPRRRHHAADRGRALPRLKKELLAAALKTFYDVRNLPGLKKKPSTSELLDWLKLLVAEDIPLEALQSKDEKVAVPPLVGALLKNEQDVTLFEKLVFMQRTTADGASAAPPAATNEEGVSPVMAFVEPVTLSARGIRLVPLDLSHEAGWPRRRPMASCGRSASPRCPSRRQTRAYIEDALQMHAEGKRVPFAVLDAATGTRCSARTSYHDIVPAVKRWRSATPGTPASRQRTPSTPPASCC